jgi:peptidoglycan hydrolase CwlO-like protein
VRLIAAVVGVALAVPGALAVPAASLAAAPSAQEAPGAGLPAADAAAAETSYTSRLSEVPRTIPAMTDLIVELQPRRDALAARLASVQAQLAAAQAQAVQAQAQHDSAQGRVTALTAAVQAAQARQAAQEQVVGALARLLYQQPSPELTAVEQLIGGEDLRAFEGQGMVTDVLQANTNELEQIKAEVAALTEQLAAAQADLEAATGRLQTAAAAVATASASQASVAGSLSAMDADLTGAQAAVQQIQAEQEAAYAAAVAAAQKAAQQAARAAQPAPQRPGGSAPPVVAAPPMTAPPAGFSMRLPTWVPFRDVFLSVGQQYGVEPALLAAIAQQESNFNPDAGCSKAGAGKGIMQHENQPAYCGVAGVPMSVARAAQMLSGYYGRFRSWPAAIFAYNNGPGLAPVWIANQGDPAAMIAALTAYYDASPWATPGPVRGYSSWGAWRARVAYSYAAAPPLPGFRSATATWMAMR